MRDCGIGKAEKNNLIRDIKYSVEYDAHKAAVGKLRADRTEEDLWNCIIAFQNYPFRTASGLPFTYALKTGHNGNYTKELFIDRREGSKSLCWCSIRLAFERCEGMGVVARPKAIGDIRGISYIYSLFWMFGLIEVPEKIAGKMSGENEENGENGRNN